MSAARQRTDRPSRTGAGSRPLANNFQHCLGEIFSALATSRTVISVFSIVNTQLSGVPDAAHAVQLTSENLRAGLEWNESLGIHSSAVTDRERPGTLRNGKENRDGMNNCA
jgi:hypothetical protein